MYKSMTIEKGFPFNKTAFNCPNCGVYAMQNWELGFSKSLKSSFQKRIAELYVALCEHCRDYSIWYNERMIYPSIGNAPSPHPSLPAEIRNDYEEARSVVSLSSRSAAAILRLCIQKLTHHILGNDKGTLNDNIAKLVKKGLPTNIQQALDIVRVTGNHAVHPGQIDLIDDHDRAIKLFELVNIITDYMIAKPKEIKSIFDGLPESDKNSIKNRDMH
jgi:hypothetical protein